MIRKQNIFKDPNKTSVPKITIYEIKYTDLDLQNRHMEEKTRDLEDIEMT